MNKAVCVTLVCAAIAAFAAQTVYSER